MNWNSRCGECGEELGTGGCTNWKCPSRQPHIVGMEPPTDAYQRGYADGLKKAVEIVKSVERNKWEAAVGGRVDIPTFNYVKAIESALKEATDGKE